MIPNKLRIVRPRIPSLQIALLIFLTVFSGCSQSKGKAGAQFEQARSLVFQGRYTDASDGFSAFLATYPNHELAVRAKFLRGKCELGKGDLQAADKWFRQTIAEHPETEEANKAKFKLAFIAILEDRREEAISMLTEIKRVANGPYTPEAEAWLTQLDAEAQVKQNAEVDLPFEAKSK